MLAVRSHQVRTTRLALRAHMDVRWWIALRRNRLADYRILSGLVANGCSATTPMSRLGVSSRTASRSVCAWPLHPAMVAMLRKHKAGQAADRLHAANQWQNSGLVFTTELGGPVDPRNLLRVIEVASKTANDDDVGVHTLRHSAAVAWLESGVHIKPVADLLGHSSIAITGDVYGHTSDDTARAAVDGLAARLGL